MQDLQQALQPAFSRYCWTLFVSTLVGLLTLPTRKTLTYLAGSHSIAAFSRFFGRYRWASERLKIFRQSWIRQRIHHRYLRKPGRRPIIYLALDDTVIPKRGKRFPGLGLHYSVTQERVTRGHDLIFSFLIVGSIQAPWDYDWT